MKMPAMATAQTAREILRRVFDERTRMNERICVMISKNGAYQRMTPKLFVSLQPPPRICGGT